MKAELTALALEIADETTRADIECQCLREDHSGKHFGPWYRFAAEVDQPDYAVRAVKYLEMRKLLKRHPDNGELFRPISRATESL